MRFSGRELRLWIVCRSAGHLVAEPEYEWRGAQLHNLGQGELDGCGVALSDECRRSVLPKVAVVMP